MFKKILGTFSTKMLSAVINLLIVVLTTRYLGTGGKGETSLIVANITLIQLLNNFIGGTALVYLVPRYKTILLLVPAYVWAIIASGIGSYFLFTVGQIELELGKHIFYLSVCYSLFSVNQMIFLGKEKIQWHNLLSLLQIAVVAVSLGIFFIYLENQSVTSFLYAIYLAYGLCFLISVILVMTTFETFSMSGFKNSIKHTISYGFVAQLSSVITFFNYRLSYYLLDFWKSKEAVGVYSTGVSIAEATWLLSKSIALVQYSKVSNESDDDKSIALTNSLTKLSFWMSFLIVIMLLSLPPFVYELIFGEGFKEIYVVILSLSIGILSISFSTTFLHYFSGKGQYGKVNIATGIALLFTLGMSIWLIPRYGIIGAGCTASIAYLAQSTYLYISYRKYSQFRILDLFKLKKEFEMTKKMFK